MNLRPDLKEFIETYVKIFQNGREQNFELTEYQKKFLEWIDRKKNKNGKS